MKSWLEEPDIITEQRGDFSVGQSYTKDVCKTVICKCGNDKFLVGQDDYFTALKCLECGIEGGIHDG